MWASMLLVTFNLSKSESFILSRKVKKPYHSHIYMKYRQGSAVDLYKHLGTQSRDYTCQNI